MAPGLTLEELAQGIGARLIGDPQVRVHGIAALDQAQPGELSFLSNTKYRKLLSDTRASAVIVQESHAQDCPVAALVCDDPYLGYAKASRLMHPADPVTPGIHPSAVVSGEAQVHESAWVGPNAVVEAGVRIGERVHIGPGAVVERDCEIGADTRIESNVTLVRGCRIGRRVLIHAGAVLGSAGFGFAREGKDWLRIPQVGRVCVGDDVEIGSNTTVDRGALGDTVISDGVILDNLIQIGHNVQVGERTAIVACTGISGSTRIGADCILGGQVGVAGHLVIEDGVVLGAGSKVTGNVSGPGRYGGVLPIDKDPGWRRNISRVRHLDELWKRVARLEKELAAAREPADEDG